MPAAPGPVIVVDDDAAVRDSLKFALELEGMSVRVYEGGAALLADAGGLARGCLVVDYSMPAMDGLELVDRLRGRRIGLPAILITGKANDDLRDRAARAGIRLVLEKPLADGALVEGIRSALSTLPPA
ncbi:MAG TPA: response regulator [Microvirga sp.]|jgi:FixJ family two-component response regulator|nr:response regulator [Microvirga sp.]